MADFQIIPMTVSERKYLQNKEYRLRNEFLYKVGYNSSGCYILSFPNGKKYIGKTKSLGARLKEHFRQLVPIGIECKNYDALWYQQAKKENEGQIKTFRDIGVQIFYTVDITKKENELLRQVPKEERDQYYNTQWNDF